MKIAKSGFDNLPLSLVNRLSSSEQDFFNSLKWFENFIETITKPMGNDVCFYYDADSQLPIILPLMFDVENSLRKINSLTNYYSPIYSILGNQTDISEQSIKDFFISLKKELPGWDIMELRPLAFEESALLVKQLKKAAMPSVSFFCFGNWYENINGRSFKNYFSGLSSQVKNTVTRKTKKFFQLEGARVEIITTEDELAKGLAAYQQVYESSWKVQEPYPEFMPGLMKQAASIDGLRLGIAYLGDQAIAAQFWIVADNTAYIFKLAYDENYKQHSAGTILTTKLMEYVIDVDKVGVVDYLCGDDAYKKDWMSNRRERWGVLVFNTSTVRGCIEYAKEMSKFFIKAVFNYFKISRNRPANEG